MTNPKRPGSESSFTSAPAAKPGVVRATRESGFTPAAPPPRPPPAAVVVTGLPIASPLPTLGREHGGTGTALAFQLSRLWQRLPGEKRLPLVVKAQLLPNLPTTVDEAAVQQRGAVLERLGSLDEVLLAVAGLESLEAVKNSPLRATALEQVGATFLVREKVRGTVLAARLREVAALQAAPRGARLATLCEDLTATGAALARFHEAARSDEPVGDGYKRLAAARALALFDAAALEHPEARRRMRDVVRGFYDVELAGTVCLGEVGPDSVAVQGAQCTVLRAAALCGSLGARGEGIGSAAEDRLGFAQSLTASAQQLGFTAEETQKAHDAFLFAYRQSSALAAMSEDFAATRLFTVRAALTDLRAGPASEEARARVLAALELAP
ncbi:MAG: hypothetical protein IPJ65_10135 [Archangiaceae bacterium]|nr:hypothetical protein [Archangiaceae bacterium]